MSLSKKGKRARHCTGTKVGGGSGTFRASWRRPSRTRVKLVSWRHGLPGKITKPAKQLKRVRQEAVRRSDERAAGRPRRVTGMSHTVGGVTTLRAARAGARARVHEHAANGATERGRRCSERSSLRAPAPPPSALPRTARASLSHAPKRRIYLPCMLTLLPEDVAQGAFAFWSKRNL